MNKKFFLASGLVVVALLAVALKVGISQAAAPAQLPYGLSMQDTRAVVEYKLGQPKVVFAPQAGWEAGKPDEASSPDHIHSWAFYKRFDITIVYNSPSPIDRSATISEIMVNK